MHRDEAVPPSGVLLALSGGAIAFSLATFFPGDSGKKTQPPPIEKPPQLAKTPLKASSLIKFPDVDARGVAMQKGGKVLAIFGGSACGCSGGKLDPSTIPFKKYDSVVVLYEGEKADIRTLSHPSEPQYRAISLNDCEGFAGKEPEWVGQWYEIQDRRVMNAQMAANARDFRLWDGTL